MKAKTMKKKNCLQCKKECPCECLEIDTDCGIIYFCSIDCYKKSDKEYSWDMDFGDYEGHDEECHLGGHFEEKWKVVLKNLHIWRHMATEKHQILHKMGYFKNDKAKKKVT